MLLDTLKLLLEKDKHFRLLLPGSDVEARPFWTMPNLSA